MPQERSGQVAPFRTLTAGNNILPQEVPLLYGPFGQPCRDTIGLQRTQRLPAPGHNPNTEYPTTQYTGKPPDLQLHREAHKRLQESSRRCAQLTPGVAQH